MILNKLELSGRCNLDTPICVIQEIADSHCLKTPLLKRSDQDNYSLVIHTINNDDLGFKVKPKFSSNNEATFRQLAAFFNKYALEWTGEQLQKAFKFYCLFFRDYVNKTIPTINTVKNLFGKYECGIPTPSNQCKISPVMILYIGKKMGLDFHPDSDITKMRETVLFCLYSKESILFQVKNVLEDLSKINLINILERYGGVYGKSFMNEDMKYDSSLVKSDIDRDRVESLYLREIEHSDVVDDETAISVAARTLDIDLHMSQFPLLEYRSVHRASEIRFHDPFLRYVYCSGRLDVKKTFNSYLPLVVYTTSRLREFCLGNGLESYDQEVVTREDAQELLCVNNLKSTFYHGLFAFPSNETDIMGEGIKDINYNNILMFGTMERKMHFTTYQELFEYFKYSKSSIIPFWEGNDMFSVESLRKLRNLVQTHHPAMIQFAAIVDGVVDQISKLTPEFTILSEYTGCDDLYKIKTLEALHDLGMAMRGYLPEKHSRLPIETAMVDNQYDVDIEVSERNTLFENLLLKDKVFERIIYSLPLFRWNKTVFIRKGDDGYRNIGERLSDVRDGSNISACIRSSSNWICATAYHYLTMFEHEMNYKIENLSYIS